MAEEAKEEKPGKERKRTKEFKIDQIEAIPKPGSLDPTETVNPERPDSKKKTTNRMEFQKKPKESVDNRVVALVGEQKQEDASSK